jgi:hypothetical protein
MPTAAWRQCAAGASRANKNATKAASDAKRVAGVKHSQYDFEDSGKLCAHEAAMAEQKKKKASKKAASLQFMNAMEGAYDGDGNFVGGSTSADPAGGAPSDLAAAGTSDGVEASSAAKLEAQFDRWLDAMVEAHTLSAAQVDRLTDALAENRVSVAQCVAVNPVHAAGRTGLKTRSAAEVRSSVHNLAERGRFKVVRGTGANMGV